MKLKGLYTAVTALALVAAPTFAAAAPVATPLTQPASEVVDGENGLRGGGLIVAFLAVGAIVLAIFIIADEDDQPNSP